MMLRLDLRVLLRPQRAHQLERLVAPARALLERHAERLELALEPADRGADDQAAARQDVDARQELRHRDRRAIGQDHHARAERYPARDTGQPRQDGQRIEHVLAIDDVLLLMLHRAPRSTLFPYTTLFRAARDL